MLAIQVRYDQVYLRSASHEKNREESNPWHVITGLSHPTIRRGHAEVQRKERQAERNRVRKPGAGRQRVEKKQPEILKALDELLKDETAGDPITGLKWTKKTSHTISRARQRQGYAVGADTVRHLLKKGRYVLRANRKRVNKRKDPNRNRQMCYLVRKRKQHEKAGFPLFRWTPNNSKPWKSRM